MTDVARRLRTARRARERRDWDTAYSVLSGLRATHDLDTDDLAALGDAAWWLGRIHETIAIGEECHERYLGEGRVERAAEVALEAAFHWMLRGEPEIGSGWVSRARGLLDGRPPGPAHGYLLWIEAQGLFEAGDLAGAVAGAHELRRLATQLDEPVLGSLALALEGTVVIRQGEVRRGLGLLDEAMLPVLAGRTPPAEAGNLYCQMISVCTDLADVVRARRWTEATERWCDTSSSAVMFAGICRVHRAQLLRQQGQWDAAVAAAEAACRELSELNAEAVAEARYEIGEAHRLRGDGRAAAAAFDAAAALGRDPQPGRALLLLDQQRSEEALASIRVALAESADPFLRARLLAAHAEIACSAGDPSAADDAATELRQIADRYDSPCFRAWADTARAGVLVALGRASEAVPMLRDALATYRKVGATWEEAVCRARLGTALVAAGDPTAGEPQVAAAREAVRHLGARVAVDRLVGDDATADPVPGGLTPRELEVLRLVAEGLSNREAAARLVISEKTVARHLANIFLKLDVSSRTAAAAWVLRRDQRG